jgi:hypothetical protein
LVKKNIKNGLLVNQKKTDENKKFRCRQTGGHRGGAKKKAAMFPQWRYCDSTAEKRKRNCWFLVEISDCVMHNQTLPAEVDEHDHAYQDKDSSGPNKSPNGQPRPHIYNSRDHTS